MLTREEYLEKLINKVKRKIEYEKLDQLEDESKLDNESFEDAIMDALSDFNMLFTNYKFTLDDLQSTAETDTRPERIVVLGASIEIIQQLIYSWAHLGEDISIAEFNLHNRLPDYESLKSSLQEDYDKLVEKFLNSRKITSGVRFSTNKSTIMRGSTYCNTIKRFIRSKSSGY